MEDSVANISAAKKVYFTVSQFHGKNYISGVWSLLIYLPGVCIVCALRDFHTAMFNTNVCCHELIQVIFLKSAFVYDIAG